MEEEGKTHSLEPLKLCLRQFVLLRMLEQIGLQLGEDSFELLQGSLLRLLIIELLPFGIAPIGRGGTVGVGHVEYSSNSWEAGRFCSRGSLEQVVEKRGFRRA